MKGIKWGRKIKGKYTKAKRICKKTILNERHIMLCSRVKGYETDCASSLIGKLFYELNLNLGKNV